MSTAGAGVGRHRAHAGGAGAARGRRASRTSLAADDPKIFTDPQSLSFQRIDVSTGAQRRVDAADARRRGRRRRHLDASRSRRRRRPRGVRSTCRARSTRRARRRRRAARRRARRRRTPRPARTTASSSSPETASSAASRTRSSSSARRSATRPSTPLKKFQTGDTRTGTNRVSVVLLPGRAVRAAAELHRRADERGRLGAPLLRSRSTSRSSTSASRCSPRRRAR